MGCQSILEHHENTPSHTHSHVGANQCHQSTYYGGLKTGRTHMDTGRTKDPGDVLPLYLPNVCPILASCTSSCSFSCTEVIFQLYTKKFSTVKVHDFKGYSMDIALHPSYRHRGRSTQMVHPFCLFEACSDYMDCSSRTSSGVGWSDHILGRGSNIFPFRIGFV